MPFCCPTCGADIPLRHVGVALFVCPYCRATCVLAEGGLVPGEVHAALLESDGPFQVGGTCRLPRNLGGATFEVTGQARYATGDGGWDEWLLTRDDGSFVVAERSEGTFIVFERRRLVAPVDLSSARPGGTVTSIGETVLVSEAGTARLIAGRGGLSAPFPAGASFLYVCGSSDRHVVKVASNGGRAVVSSGEPVELDDLGIA